MAVAFSRSVSNPNAGPDVVGNHYIVYGTLQMSDSYPTGGEVLSAASFNFPDGHTLRFILIEPQGGYVFNYDYTNGKVLAYRSAGSAAAMAEAPNTTDLHTLTPHYFALSH